MSDHFGERITPARAIRQILDQYPFSAGLFREILQNSDDAKATKQIFILDHRTHPTSSLLHPYLKCCQGPALLAYNDGTFEEEDWRAIQEISNSSKKADTSKIGKYGLGFRSCYHVTDHPHILSGSNFAIFDPENKFNDNGGVRVSFVETSSSISDHLAAFNSHATSPLEGNFTGTIIRLPLRTEEHIDGLGKVVSVHMIQELLHEFAKEELKVVLLFLKHVSSVELCEVDDTGRRVLATAHVRREVDVTHADPASQAHFDSCHVTANIDGEETRDSWIINYYSPDFEHMCSTISGRLQHDVRDTMIEKKLIPNVGLAFPMHAGDISPTGRLFTFLPLPIYTGFPCHVHALFALTPDRQHLVNAEETGLLEGSLHRQLVEWNRVLFEEVLPQAWNCALVYFTTLSDVRDIFSLWPGEQARQTTGDVAYWARLPEGLIKSSDNTCIWPIHHPSDQVLSTMTTSASLEVLSQDRYAMLDTLLLLAPRYEQDKLCDILAAAGVNVTQVPLYVYHILVDKTPSHTFRPRRVWERLSESNMDLLSSLRREATNALLVYLVSDGDVLNVLGLPVFDTRASSSVTLLAAGASSKRIMLRIGEDFFSDLDSEAILLRDLPQSVSRLLLSQGPRKLNVEPLTKQNILSYITKCTQGSESPAGANASQSEWLLRFWAWVPTTAHEKELMLDNMFTHLAVLPTSQATLFTLQDNVFVSPDSSELVTALHELTYRLLHPQFPRTATAVLKRYEKIHSPDDIRAVLRHAPSTCPAGWNRPSAIVLRDHIVSILVRLGSKKRLDPQLRTNLRSLPIFETCLSDAGDFAWTSIPAGHAIVNIPLSIGLVPVARSMTFARDLDGVIAKHLDNVRENGRALSYTELVRLSVEHLPAQTKFFQARLVQNLVTNRTHVPPNILDSLKRIAFVEASMGHEAREPVDLLEPGCDIAQKLYDSSSSRLPALNNASAIQIVNSLSSLGLLRTTFTTDIIEECIASITNQSVELEKRHAKARDLLDLIRLHKYKCSGLSPKPSWKAWLPTEKLDLTCIEDCFDPWYHRRELFDAVAPVLATEISTALRKVISLDVPVPIDVIIPQLDATLRADDDDDKYSRLVTIYTELGRRHSKSQLTDENIHQLISVISEHHWIPIQPGTTLSTKYAAFSLPFSETSGLRFRSIPSTLTNMPGVRALFEAFGCSQAPTNQALIDELAGFSGTLVPSDLELAIVLLRALTSMRPNEDAFRQTQVPDFSSTMRPFAQIYFNDVGHRLTQVEIPPGRFCSHAHIDIELARRLRLSFLSTIALPMAEDEVDEDDMEEKLTTRISNVLRQYTPERSFLEFVANAVDAGASEVNLLLDDVQYPRSGDFITQEMADFQGHALVIHNNAVFQDKDWKGIRKVGLGGKQGSQDTIGRFGLGALSMFHFTEMAMIVSNDHVLFIDPSRQHITSEKNRASRKITLRMARQMYRDHLQPLDGLFGFSLASDHYDGTLFRLALRTAEQVTKSEMTNTELDIDDLTMNKFQRTAEDCLLFTSILSITGRRRNRLAVVADAWSWQAERKAADTEEKGVKRMEIIIEHRDHNTAALHDGWQNARSAPSRPSRKKWITVTKQVACPAKFDELKVKHRMPPMISIGLATTTRIPTRTSRDEKKVFSSMPLPVPVLLPVSINASFILADDRRSIRFDESGMDNLESAFNRWLLSDSLPPIYYALLAHLPPENVFEWWPRQRFAKDPLAGPVIQAFYKGLAKCDANICVDAEGKSISPRRAVFLPTEPARLSHLFHDILKGSGLVLLPIDLRHATFNTGVSQLDADRARSYLLSHSQAFSRAYEEKNVVLADLQVLIDFIGSKHLVDLPLLALADNTVTTFSDSLSRKLTFIAKNSDIRPWPFLPADRFIHPDLNLRHLVREPTRLRISTLSSAALGQLIRDRIPDGNSRDLNPEDAEWAKSVWSMVNQLLEPSESSVDISRLPLVPTANGTTHISLHTCTAENSEVLVAPPAKERFLRMIMEHFGAKFIEADNLPEELRKRLGSANFSLETALKFLHSLGPTAVRTRFDKLSPENQERLGEWVISSIRYKAKKDLKKLLGISNLPIWTSYRRGASDPRFETMSNIHMLPPKVSASVVLPFLENLSVCEHSKILVELGKRAMSFSELRDQLEIPRSLNDEQMLPYRRLLATIMEHRSEDLRPPLVPNRSGLMVLPSTLYRSTQEVFAAAFSTQMDRFIHIHFENQEMSLVRCGLKDTVTLDTFIACARAIHQDVSPDRHVRAAILFDWYNNNLPRDVANLRSLPPKWRLLDDLDFIPARRERRREIMWSQDYADHLEEDALRSPGSMLRLEYQGIAWTQRFLFVEEPSPLLQFTDRDLGVPTARNVVDHLGVLSTRIALDHPRNETVLADLRATYRWLAEHVNEAAPLLMAIKGFKLWLNVDDPQEDDWKWLAAEQLVFNGLDSEENGQWEARQFLEAFKRLLLASGAREIQRPSRPEIELTPVELQHQAARVAADGLRAERKLTDVLFVAEGGEEFAAHRLWMSTVSSYFLDLFSSGSGFIEGSNDASPANPVRVHVPHTPDAVRACLDHVYLRATPNNFDTEALVDTMQLAHYWDLQDFFQQIQQLLVEGMALWNYEYLEEEARSIDADHVLKACREFRVKNASQL